MSRSKKHIPSYSDYSRNYTKWSKRQASKKVRRYYDLTDGKLFRKVYNSWNIFDYKGVWTISEFGHGLVPVPRKAWSK